MSLKSFIKSIKVSNSLDLSRPWSGYYILFVKVVSKTTKVAYAYAGLRLCWSHIPNCWKSHAVAQM